MRRWLEDFVDKVICGDSVEVMKEIPDGSVDLILTDPPYNAANIGPKHRVYSRGPMQLSEEEYGRFCEGWWREAKRISPTIVFTPGISNIARYPQPFWVLCWHKPAAVSFNRMGGFNAWEPIFLYGKPARRIGQDYVCFNTVNLKKGVEAKHPCPKPLSLWNWLVYHFSKKNDIIVDPFFGSGTTGVSAKKFQRRYVGVEINPDYCKIAEQRLANVEPELQFTRSEP